MDKDYTEATKNGIESIKLLSGKCLWLHFILRCPYYSVNYTFKYSTCTYYMVRVRIRVWFWVTCT